MALKILLADDNITAQKMGSKILTDAGHRVVSVSNGAAAMKKIASEKPDLLILDVYMPGYTGLEVCQKVKSAGDTADMPVLLTVTNMEPFNPADGNKVRADGVIVKPFEASDLVAVVQKLEQKLQLAAAEAEHEKTAKLPTLDASYEELKVEAPPAESVETAGFAVPQDMASAPALGMEHMLVESPPPRPATSTAPTSVTDLGLTEPPAAAAAEPVIPPAPEVEFTSEPVGDVEVAPAPELEVNGQAEVDAAAEVPIARDPALVTDAADMAQFVTKFGDAPDQPSFIPAAPEVVASTREASEPPQAAPPVAFEAPAQEAPPEPVPEQVEASGEPSLEEEMRRAFQTGIGSGAAAAPALAPEPEPVEEPEPEVEAAPFVDVTLPPLLEPSAPPPQTTPLPDRLAEQFAAELAQAAPSDVTIEEISAAEEAVPPAAEPVEEVMPPERQPEASTSEPPPEAALDEQRVSEAVQRVMSRYKDELVAAIVRELKS